MIRTPTVQLAIESKFAVLQHSGNSFDLLIEDYAVKLFFNYLKQDCLVLSPYVAGPGEPKKSSLVNWSVSIWNARESVLTTSIFLRFADRIRFDIEERAG